jgi:hypothetical protein
MSHTKVTSLGETLPSTFVEFYNAKIYRVVAFGTIYPKCRVIGYCEVSGIKSWRFESLEEQTKGERIGVWDRNSFSVVDP